MNLLDLNKHTRRASLGNEYKFLKQIYPKWSYDLHASGNTLENEKLEIIGINGLVLWYFEKYCPIPVTYNFNNLKTFIDNTKTITYYDFINILKLLEYLNITIDEIKQFDFSYKTKDLFLSIYYKKTRHPPHKYYIIPFGYF